MKKRIIVIVVVLLVLLVPIPMHLKDGGTVEYKALTYKISKVHRLNNNSKTGYEDGIIIEILGIKIYDKVFMEDIANNTNNSDIPNNAGNKIEEITWEEITEDGVNEELLLKNVDEELLTQIATELQTLIEEAKEEERENPEILITEGWARIFEYERYKKVLNMGKPAMKPLYLIIYKSPYADEYEYLCARILYELSGFDFYWTNSKNFLEGFNQKIMESRKINVTINGKKYAATIEDNETAQTFINRLPQNFNMNELNGNEKYVYMDNFLPTNALNPKHIESGDIMLYESNCLVIFYKSFDTNYSYTRIGHIDNLPDLGKDNIEVKFERLIK